METCNETVRQDAPQGLPEGLTAADVHARTEAGQVNVNREKSGKSYGRIILTNLLTFFNMVWAVIAALMISLGEYSNLTFLFVIIPNVLIAIVLECRAKHTVEKLSVTTDPKATVVRDGVLTEIPGEALVLGDVMRVDAGHQVLCDAEVISGLAEANESLLTGESNAVKKVEGDRLLGGSYLVSGSVFARVTAVGKDNYVHTIEKAAKSFKKPASDLFRDLNRLLRYIAIFMVPMAVAMYISNYYAGGQNVHTSLVKTSGSLIGMIPAGMYLLITVTLTLSVIKLSRRRTLVQDMYSIEMLARADVLCLDKTGTITDGTMCVSDVIPLDGHTVEEVGRLIACIEGAESSKNATSRALTEAFGENTDVTVTDRVPFSSERKYSAVALEGIGVFSIGAPHFVRCPVTEALEGRIATFAAEGKRVLLLASHPAPEQEGEPLALIAVTDRIRPNAEKIIANFQNQGVSVRIISGDHAATVSAIAARVGVKNADKFLSCENLTDDELAARCEDYAVFGRVTPEQKVLLVKRLKELGHTVAMTGDGVNDTLALKESNCSIAMAQGSEMACRVSQIVLLDSDFATLPDVVREGRRCINNVRQSATLFIMKTILTIMLSLYAVCTVTLYPFAPKNMMLLETFVIGISAFLLAFEPNNERIEGSFIKSVILRSLPSAMALFCPVLVLLLLGKAGVFPSSDVCNELCMVAMTVAGYVNLAILCIPYTKWRAVVVIGMGVLIAAAIPVTMYMLGDMLDLHLLSGMTGTVAVICAAAFALTIVIQTVAWLIRRTVKARRAARA